MAKELLDKYRAPTGSTQITRRMRPVCISFFTDDKDFYAFPYGHLIWVNFHPSRGLQIHFSSHTVTIEGSRLEPVYRDLLLHRVEEISVPLGRTEMQDVPPPDTSTPSIKSVKVTQPKGLPYGAGMLSEPKK